MNCEHFASATPCAPVWLRCVGYRQAWEYLEGKITKAELRDRGIYATRQLAKRRPTWLPAMEVLLVVDCLAKDASPQMHEIAAREFGTTKNADKSHE